MLMPFGGAMSPGKVVAALTAGRSRLGDFRPVCLPDDACDDDLPPLSEI